MQAFKLLRVLACALFLLICSPAIIAKAVVPNIYFKERNLEKYPLQICVDSSFFYPFSFSYKNKPVGMHTDIVINAISRLGFKAKFYAKTLSECLLAAESGDDNFDAILPLSYTKTRTKFFTYPEDATPEAISKWRLSHVSYILVTPPKKGATNAYEFDGNVEKIPEPIRFIAGSSLQEIFPKTKKLSLSNSLIKNINELLETNQGSVITNYDSVTAILRKMPVKSNLKLHKQPVVAKSYYLAFIKKTDVSRRSQRKIWESIREVRNDPTNNDLLLAKYGFAK